MLWFLVLLKNTYIYLSITAPNDYRTENVNLDKSPEYSFGLKPKTDKLSDVPGN